MSVLTISREIINALLGTDTFYEEWPRCLEVFSKESREIINTLLGTDTDRREIPESTN